MTMLSIDTKTAKKNKRFNILLQAALISAYSRFHPFSESDFDIKQDSETGEISASGHCPCCEAHIFIETKPQKGTTDIGGFGVSLNCVNQSVSEFYVAKNFMKFDKATLKEWFKTGSMSIDWPTWLKYLIDAMHNAEPELWELWEENDAPESDCMLPYYTEIRKITKQQARHLGIAGYNYLVFWSNEYGDRRYDWWRECDFEEFKLDNHYLY